MVMDLNVVVCFDKMKPPSHMPPLILFSLSASLVIRDGNRAGRAGLGWTNSGPGQNRAGPKLARFFRAEILTAQPALKTGPVGPNSLFKAKKNSGEPGQAGPYRVEPYRAGPNLAQFFSGQ